MVLTAYAHCSTQAPSLSIYIQSEYGRPGDLLALGRICDRVVELFSSSHLPQLETEWDQDDSSYVNWMELDGWCIVLVTLPSLQKLTVKGWDTVMGLSAAIGLLDPTGRHLCPHLRAMRIDGATYADEVVAELVVSLDRRSDTGCRLESLAMASRDKLDHDTAAKLQVVIDTLDYRIDYS